MKCYCTRRCMMVSAALLAAFVVAAVAQVQPASDQAPQEQSPSQADAKVVYVHMATSKGDIVLELNREKAPITVDNFLSYTEKGFYDGTIFHRVINGFMIQGGGFTPDMQQKPTEKPIKNEWTNGLKNVRGSIAMARTAAPDSASSQFFINVVDNPNLDQPISGGAGYAVFGKVVAGMDVVDVIKSVPTRTHPAGHQNVPVEPVVITKVKKISEEEAKKLIEAKQKPAPTPAGS